MAILVKHIVALLLVQNDRVVRKKVEKTTIYVRFYMVTLFVDVQLLLLPTKRSQNLAYKC
jgi:hypothetical protein